jgi:hypothetical protein
VSVGKAKLENSCSRVKSGELHRVEVKLWKRLWWIRKGCGGLPTVDKGLAGEEFERRRRSEARGEIGLQKSMKRREGKPLNVLDQQRRMGEARTGASYDGGEVAAGQSSGGGGAMWSERKNARGEELGRRLAWRRRVGATRVGGGAGRAAVTVSSGGDDKQLLAARAAAWRARGRQAGER